MADRRAVDLHEHDPKPIRDVLHQRRLAVTGRRDQQQQTHSVRPLVFASRTHLFGQVVADQRQVDFVEQAIAHETGQHAWLEFFQPHLLAGFVHHTSLGGMQTAEPGHDRLAIASNATQQFVIVQRHTPFDDSRVIARQIVQPPRDRRLGQIHLGRPTGKNDPSEFITIAFGRIDLAGVRVRGQERIDPIPRQDERSDRIRFRFQGTRQQLFAIPIGNHPGKLVKEFRGLTARRPSCSASWSTRRTGNRPVARALCQAQTAAPIARDLRRPIRPTFAETRRPAAHWGRRGQVWRSRRSSPSSLCGFSHRAVS